MVVREVCALVLTLGLWCSVFLHLMIWTLSLSAVLFRRRPPAFRDPLMAVDTLTEKINTLESNVTTLASEDPEPSTAQTTTSAAETGSA
jgi:hypothetical protein